jgi:predicted ATPase
LKHVSLLKERVEDWQPYPFSVPTIAPLSEFKIPSRVCFFTGENGSGKSTLLEAIAGHHGFGKERGPRNFFNDSTASNHSVDPFIRALRLSCDRRTGAAFFLRAESFFDMASHIDELDLNKAYGGSSLHQRSHGETFFTLLDLRFRQNGLFLLDEPEAALSPQRQLSFLVLIHDTLASHRDAQFIISTHSPILLGFPNAQILSFDNGAIHELTYQETSPLQLMKRFVNDRDNFLREVLRNDELS